MSQKCKALSLKNKIEILKEFDKSAGLTKVQFAKKLDIPVSTMKTIVYDKKRNGGQGSCFWKLCFEEIMCTKGKFSKGEDIVTKFFA